MRLTADRIGVLVEHGLSEYQARVYLALLDFPALNAGALAKAAQIPRNRLYEVLEELQAMGLVEILLDETRKYRALPLSEYLDRSVSDLRDRITRIEAQKDYLGAAFQPPALAQQADLEPGATRVLLTRRAVAREIDRILEQAKTSVLAVGSVGGWLRLVSHVEKTPAPVVQSGRIELFLPRSAAASGGAERLPDPWLKAVRYLDLQTRTLSIVVDEREMLLIHPIPDDDKVRVGRDFALLSENPAFVRDWIDLVRTAADAARR